MSDASQSHSALGQSKDKETELLDGLATLAYNERLSEFIRGSTRHVVGGTTVIDFRPLYAVTIHHLQNLLAKELKSINDHVITDDKLDSVADLLKTYTQSLRDFEYIHANRFQTQFVKDIAASRIDTGSPLQKVLIDEIGLQLDDHRSSIFSDEDLLGSFDHTLLQHSSSLGKTRGSRRHDEDANKSAKEARRRFWFAFLGAVAIVGPTMIIVAGQVSVRTLVTVSVSIFALSCAVAIFSSASPENILAATATYSAVLMVFVGSGQSSG